MTDTPRRPPLAILIAVSMVGPLSLNIFLPSMPGLQGEFGVGFSVVQLTLTLYLLGLAVAQLAYGPLSDRFGRRPMLLAGMGLFLVGTLACLVAPTIELLIAGRLVQAVGSCSGMVLARATIRDVYDREHSASMIAYVTMAMVVAPMLAPTIGGFLDVWFGWRASFVFLLVFGSLVLVGAVAFLSETRQTKGQTLNARGLLTGVGRLLRIRAFCGYGFQVGFTTGVFFSFLGGAPYVTVELFGRPPSEYGLYFMSIAGMYMVGNFLSGRLAVRLGIDRLIWTGTVLALIGAGILGILSVSGTLSVATMFAAMSIISLSNGLSIPNGLAGATSVDPRLIGAAAGFSGFLQTGLGALMSYVVGILLSDTPTPMIAIMGVSAVLAFLSFVFGNLTGRSASSS